MASETRLAFSHPSERAIATAGDEPRDRISLRDHIVEVEIGAFQAERGTQQRVRFNVVVEVVPFKGPIDDDVDRILSYDRVTEAIAHELEAERLNLLETLAERIAERILLEPQAMRTFVRIEKMDRGPGELGVEIVRSKRDFGEHLEVLADEVAQEQPRPRLVYLSNDAIAHPELSTWIDELAARKAPLILCVGLPDLERPKTQHKMTQRRIDLLAIEQNGWCLAARDLRCKVVATRTELDWAMKNEQICVWAPSKIVLDAVQGPEVAPKDSVALSAWFAEELDACELVVIGEALPETGATPKRGLALGQALF
ncbi:bifunctional dihydroneopterin aldolase/dihydroneopterin triphosphate 2'-epimerase [Pelagimonas phthalicica]|uniref:dihydroneopterin aldolase n=1 Tax=Pelagimonas phthalicica TaxID=1037362 RepID=A0A238JE68_9RHOB|nr:dihydroneopterin aldolase [Pelagimonas phthalicica]TDS91908.1 dihydroneopterin aldolase [Pelagimonas phthalicica]SMX28958.1 bifunctional dihydroneopterin aldolase/dihydroneopterin triphosphate 2'-epimerase [Pelagimonas phthalicica]